MTRTMSLQTDTTGAWNWRGSIADADQPHMVRLAWVIDEDGEIVQEWCKLIRPKTHWEFEPDAMIANGISREIAETIGVPLNYVMAGFVADLDTVDRVVAFNADFHTKVLQRSAIEVGLNGAHLFNEHPVACAMRRATDIVQKPRMQPGGGYSWPKLVEAYAFFGGDDLPSLDMDPIERGIAMARCVHVIDQGILDSQRSVSHE